MTCFCSLVHLFSCKKTHGSLRQFEIALKNAGKMLLNLHQKSFVLRFLKIMLIFFFISSWQPLVLSDVITITIAVATFLGFSHIYKRFLRRTHPKTRQFLSKIITPGRIFSTSQWLLYSCMKRHKEISNVYPQKITLRSSQRNNDVFLFTCPLVQLQENTR